MTRMRDAFNPTKWQGQGHDVNLKAVQVVAGLLVFVVILTVVGVVMPVLLKAERGRCGGRGRYRCSSCASGWRSSWWRSARCSG